MLFISGQARSEHTSYGKPVRQVGTQEFPIVNVTSQMTKMAVFVKDVGAVKPSFEAVYQKSIEGRPGPVWVDLPVDVQWSQI